MNQQTPPVFYKNPGLAAVLSFFYMGLGQIYNGQLSKGIAFIIAYTISWLLMFIIIGFITTPLMWIYGMYDAYKSAEKINSDIARTAGGGPAVN
jgi:TM2 domain-containing membrane protein YozV